MGSMSAGHQACVANALSLSHVPTSPQLRSGSISYLVLVKTINSSVERKRCGDSETENLNCK